jgi:plastocyanin
MAGIDVINSTFAPNPVTIHVGDTVHWVWDTNDLSTTSVAGSVESWDSGVQNAGFMYDHTFTHTGTFIYYSKVGGQDNGNGTASGMFGTIIVMPPSPLTSIMVTPANFSMAVGTTEQYMAMGFYADNMMEDVSSQVNWTSSNTSVATISNASVSQGLVTAIAPGATTISASFDGFSGSTALTVTKPTPILPPMPPPLVTITNVQDVTNKKHQVTQITVDFSGAVNAAEAANKGTFELTTAGKKGSFTAKDAKHIQLRSAAYDGVLNELTLTPRKAFALTKPVQFLIYGQSPGGLQDSSGQFIDGGGEGHGGDDAVFILTRKGVVRA